MQKADPPPPHRRWEHAVLPGFSLPFPTASIATVLGQGLPSLAGV